MATAFALKPGIGGRVYRNTGTYGSPSWTSQTFVQSVSAAMPWTFAEAGARESRAMYYMKTRADFQCQIVFRADDNDAGYLAARANANTGANSSVIDYMILDGLISVEGVHGWRGEMILSLASEPQEMDGAIVDTFDVKPTVTTNGFLSTVIMGASSTPAFTAL